MGRRRRPVHRGGDRLRPAGPRPTKTTRKRLGVAHPKRARRGATGQRRARKQGHRNPALRFTATVQTHLTHVYANSALPAACNSSKRQSPQLTRLTRAEGYGVHGEPSRSWRWAFGGGRVSTRYPGGMSLPPRGFCGSGKAFGCAFLDAEQNGTVEHPADRLRNLLLVARKDLQLFASPRTGCVHRRQLPPAYQSPRHPHRFTGTACRTASRSQLHAQRPSRHANFGLNRVRLGMCCSLTSLPSRRRSVPIRRDWRRWRGSPHCSARLGANTMHRTSPSSCRGCPVICRSARSVSAGRR